MMPLDFSDAGEQRTFDLIPDRTSVVLHTTVRPGGAGDGGFLKRSKDGLSEALDLEFTVVDGPYAKRKLWDRLLIGGTTPGHEEAAGITRRRLRAILESARGVRPDDKSEAAAQARRAASWSEFDGIRFMARVGIEPAQGQYRAKNFLLEVITPDRQDWRRVEQVPQASKPAPQAAASAVTSLSAPPATKPAWAK
jgi:hypothetical protein